MPIISIISQPSTNELKAAYRPIVFIIRASRTDDTAQPPVVYCDIYVGGVYYKSQEKTIYRTLNTTDSDWMFDIQDACQEVLTKRLANNPSITILAVAEPMKSIYCKFRSSGINAEGFITPEDTAPVQGTGSSLPVAGTGTQSNTFYAVNATLQHEQNQVLASHLNAHKKNGTWANLTYPLSHRPNGYKIGRNDADVFPIIHLGPLALKCLGLRYRLKGNTSYSLIQNCIIAPDPCNINIEAMAITIYSQDPVSIYVIYHATWTVTGDPLTTYTKEFSTDDGATWSPLVDITISDATQIYYALGSGSLNMAPRAHKIRITPTGASSACASAIATYGTCTPVSIDESPLLPDGEIGSAYDYVINLLGTTPFTLTSIVKRSWMTITVIGSTIEFGGIPDVEETNVDVSFTINNCDADTVDFAQTIDVTDSSSLITIEIANNDTAANIESVGPISYSISTGAYPIGPLSGITGVHAGTTVPIDVVVSGLPVGRTLRVTVNSVVIESITPINAAGTYSFAAHTIITGDIVLINLF